MININEYLLGKTKEKKIKQANKIDRPTEKSDVEDIMKWLDGFGLYNWDVDHKWPDKKEEGEFGWHTDTNNWGEPSIYFSNQYAEHAERCVRIHVKRKAIVSYGYTSKDVGLDFDEALEFIELMIEKPTEYIDPVKWRKDRRTKIGGYMVL